MRPLFVYLIAVNAVTFVTFGLDKMHAQFSVQRVREATLLVLSLLGGSPAALAGMRLFRHKTKKTAFQAAFLIILLAQIGAVFFVLNGASIR